MWEDVDRGDYGDWKRAVAVIIFLHRVEIFVRSRTEPKGTHSTRMKPQCGAGFVRADRNSKDSDKYT